MMKIREKIEQWICQVELAAVDRHKERAQRALQDLWNELDDLYFSEKVLDDSEPIGYLLPDDLSDKLTDAGVRTAGDFRSHARHWYLTIANIGPYRLAKAMEALARFGVGPSKLP